MRNESGPPECTNTQAALTTERQQERRTMASRKTTPRKSVKPSAEDVIIRECVIYAQALAAHGAGFKADPDGNNDYAAALGRAHYDLAQRTLGKITAMPAVTPSGLQAKARILPLVVDDGYVMEGGEDRGPAAEFFRSFAAEVKAFLAPMIEAEWQRRNDVGGAPRS
jgi:hypothetical protein